MVTVWHAVSRFWHKYNNRSEVGSKSKQLPNFFRRYFCRVNNFGAKSKFRVFYIKKCIRVCFKINSPVEFWLKQEEIVLFPYLVSLEAQFYVE